MHMMILKAIESSAAGMSLAMPALRPEHALTRQLTQVSVFASFFNFIFQDIPSVLCFKIFQTLWHALAALLTFIDQCHRPVLEAISRESASLNLEQLLVIVSKVLVHLQPWPCLELSL